MIEPMILPSGATLLAEERRDSPSFTLAIFFPIGSRNEAPHAEGFVHFLEHMLFKGTVKRDTRTLWRDIERTGGYANGYTDRDGLCVQVSVPARYWRTGLDFALETCFGSTFPEVEFEREKRVILSEILQIEDEPEEMAFDAFLGKFWEGNPASRPIAGSKARIKAITRDELYSFYLDTIRPQTAIIAATGPIDSTILGETLGEVVESCLAAILALPRLAQNMNLKRAQIETLLLASATPQPHSFSGYMASKAVGQVYYFDVIQLAPSSDPLDFVGLCLANSILGEASTSRLFSRLREEEGLVYTVQSSFAAGRNENLLLIQAICSDDRLPACIAAIDEEMEKLLSSGVDAAEFLDARSRLAGGFELSLEDPDARIRRLGHWYSDCGFLPSVGEELKMYTDASKENLDKALESLASGTRGRFAYGGIRKRTQAAIAFKEI